MLKHYAWALIAFIFIAGFLCCPALAKEDTAQITLKKTAVSKQNLHKYVVKKGDVISAIIRSIPGITEADIPDVYRTIKELNPDVQDLNKLYAGQLLVIPGKDTSGTEESKESVEAKDESTKNGVISTGESQNYKIKKGDSLIRIIYRELKIKTDIIKTLSIIKSMNPRISNVDKIYYGQIIKLPDKTLFVKAPEEMKDDELITLKPAESKAQPDKVIEVKEKVMMPPEARLAVIKQVISQMKGSVTSTGNYYLPIPKTGQVTIDCTKIPVVEFDDGTTTFLDLENRISADLKRMIRENWKNFRLVEVDKKDDVIAILKKLIATTKTFSMIRKESPLTIGTLPPVELFVDWVIVRTDSKDGKPLQGLRYLIPESYSLLPKAIKNYAQTNGIAITEIDSETGITGKPEELYALPPMTVFPATSAKDFSYSLLTYLGFTAIKNADIKVFDKEKNGLDLSLNADVLVKDGAKQYIIYSRSMPQQFINVLTQAKYELIFVTDTDSPKVIMENILRKFNIPFASGYFTFSGIDKNYAPFSFSFSGTKIKTDKDLYVIDFDIDQSLRGLLQESWSANVVRY
jgi:LysM repeat protein